MSRDFQQTHENLLLCAQKHFLEYGYERASIREICKDAHVTNGAFYNHFDDKESLFGALVEPVVQEVKAIYDASVNEHMELAKTDDLKSIWKLSEETLKVIIEYIYEHFDVFRLLLMRAEGTRYSSFLDDVVRLETQVTLKRGMAYFASCVFCIPGGSSYAQFSQRGSSEICPYACLIF